MAAGNKSAERMLCEIPTPDALGMNKMLYRVKVGLASAIVANERDALAMLARLTETGNEEVSILDVLGSEVDIAMLKARLAQATCGST
jgi:hypothetical protein